MTEDKKRRVGIVFGGQSAEHEISILSARNVLAALDLERFEPVPIGIDKSGRWHIHDPGKLLSNSHDPRRVRIEYEIPQAIAIESSAVSSALVSTTHLDVVFPVLHGTMGEDGAVQGLFEIAGIPYVGAGILGSAIGMDKDVTKRLLRDAGIPVANFKTVRHEQFLANQRVVCEEIAALGFPLFVKPANSGSSVGISKVKEATGVEGAVRRALEFDSKILAEAAVAGRELELAVLGGDPPRASVAGEIIVNHADGFYSYSAKYLDKTGATLALPARISEAVLHDAQMLALRAFETLECSGMARVDLFLKPDSSLLVNEINTLPGFTSVSMYPKLWNHSGVPLTELITNLIELAIDRKKKKELLRRSIVPGESS